MGLGSWKINTVNCAKAEEALPKLPDNCIDAVVTDAPYHLIQLSRGGSPRKNNLDNPAGRTRLADAGFMGQNWDGGDISFRPELWAEVLRVLKPGGYLLSFGGSRTYHRMACAIEDAGFMLHPMIGWIYGCLSEDTEILTLGGWKHYHKNIEQEDVLCYNVDNNSFEFHKPSRSFVCENKHTAYSIKSDKTDQIVSRNHRVLVERGGRKVFCYAEALKREENVSILESMSDLSDPISLSNTESIPYKEHLFPGVQRKIDLQEQNGETGSSDDREKSHTDKMSSLWKRSLQIKRMVKKGFYSNMLTSLQRCITGQRMEETRVQGTIRLDRRIPQILSEEDVWPKQSGVEGGSHISQAEGELRQSEHQVCEMPPTVFRNGTERRLCDGAQAISCPSDMPTVVTTGSGTPRQRGCGGQSVGKFGSVQEQLRAQIIRTLGKPTTVLARVRPVRYRGIMWCVKVPTGAFIARRNGQIFITGNSGFPKATNLSAQLDKAAGAERKEVGKVKRWGANASGGRGNQRSNSYQSSILGAVKYDVLTEPATDEAKQWDGWYYGRQSLKPAFEPICMAQKPPEGRMVDNVLKHGVGAINVDGCRIEYVSDYDEKHQHDIARGQLNARKGRMFGGDVKSRASTEEPLGRYPANIIHDGSDEVMTEFEKAPKVSPTGTESDSPRKKDGSFLDDVPQGNHYLGDTGTPARFFYCAKSSKSERNMGLESTGGNSHPTVKPIKLCRYLCRLITPPGGIVLDHFTGSGSIPIGAYLEGFNYLGFDQEQEYIDIARKRLIAAKIT